MKRTARFSGSYESDECGGCGPEDLVSASITDATDHSAGAEAINRWGRQPDRTDLLPPRRDAFRDPTRDRRCSRAS
jgi:hypothetical protein